jgi:hypothetical protein
VSFEPAAKLTRISRRAFIECCSLQSFAIPDQLEILEFEKFSTATPLLQLTFEIPSRLRRLCLARVCVDDLCIPDSVEFISCWFETAGRHTPVVQFGRESRLIESEFTRSNGDSFSRKNRGRRPQLFVRVSEEVLRRFRIRFEAL